MKPLKSLVMKAMTLACLVALSGAASAAPVTQDQILDFGAKGNYTVVTGGTSFVDYQVLLTKGQSFLHIDLLETSNPNKLWAAYKLWEDLNPEINKIVKGDLVEPRTVIDLMGTISWAVESGKQYVLRINPLGGADVEARSSVSAVPLPGAVWLFGSALLGFLGLSNRRKI